MDIISERHYVLWNEFSDEKLQRHFLYITRWSRDENLKEAMDRLMSDRKLKVFPTEFINSEFKKAMQTTYFKDDVLLDRVYNVLYGKESNK